MLDRLKRSPTTRHIPVHVISVDEMSRRGAALGAFAYLEKPVSHEALEGAFEQITTFLDRTGAQAAAGRGRRHGSARRIVELVGDGDDVEVTAVRTAEEALDALESDDFDCMVVDLILPGDDGIRLIEKVRAQGGARASCRSSSTPARISTPEDESALKKYAAVGDPEERGALARAPAQRDRAVPPPRREPAARTLQGGAGGEPAQRRPRSRAARCWSSTTTSATSSR